MQPQDKPNLHYPKMKYHWTKDPAIVNNADDGAALGGGWADTPAAFAAYSGPRPPRTAEQTPIKWVDDWTVPGVTSDHRQRIKIELLRADVAFWKSPDTPDAHHTATRLAFEGVAMVLFAAGILTENLLRNEIPQSGVGLRDRRGLVALCFRDASEHLPRTGGSLLGVAR